MHLHKLQQYLECIKDIPNEKHVCIDEKMYRQYTRSPRGVRVKIAISGKRHIRAGLVAVQCEGKLIAPFNYNGTIKSDLFEKWFLK